MQDRIFKVKEVAQMFGVHKSTVYRWVKLGLIPCLRIGSSLRIPAGMLQDMDISKAPEASR